MEKLPRPVKLFQWLVTITVKNLHFISSLNFSSFDFQALDLHLPLSTTCDVCHRKSMRNLVILYLEQGLNK